MMDDCCEPMSKSQDRRKAILDKASKASGSRILMEKATEADRRKEMDPKMDAVDSLHYSMMEKIRSGNMEPGEALDDFAEGAKAIFGAQAKKEAKKGKRTNL